MVCAPVRSIIPSLKLGDFLSVQAHKPSSISHIFLNVRGHFEISVFNLLRVNCICLKELSIICIEIRLHMVTM